MQFPLGFGAIVVALIVVVVVAKTATVVPQQMAYVVEYLGKYSRTLQAGFHILIPFVEKIAYRHSLKEIAIDIAEQICITRDNVQVGVDAVLYMQVLDPHLASYGIANYGFAISQLAQTTLRSEIGKIELDRTFEARGVINANVVGELDKASVAWGVKVLRYEIKNITPPKDVLSAMEKQMRAEREKRAVVLTSEGERDAKINAAEGDKQRVIKQSEANKQQQINEAEGQAQAILAVATATAEGLRQVGIALSDRGGIEAMQLRIGEEYVKQFGKLAQSGTTLVVPANLTDLASIVTMATSIARTQVSGGAARDNRQNLSKSILFAGRRSPAVPISFVEFVALAAAMQSTQALAIDSMLPALPAIARALGVSDPNHGQWIVTAYMAGLGLGQLFWGMLSDRFGRRPVLLGGLTLYVAAALSCGLAGSFQTLLAGRCLHGIAAASMTVVRSAVRDQYSGRRMARVMSLMFMVFLTVPILAPSLGQLVLAAASWRYIFIACGLFGTLVWVWACAAHAGDFASRIPAQLTSAARAGRGEPGAGQPHLDFLHVRLDLAVRRAHRLCRDGAAGLRRRLSTPRVSCRSCSRCARFSWVSPPIATRVSSSGWVCGSSPTARYSRSSA